MKRKHEEHYAQVLLFKWLRTNPATRNLVCFAIPNAFCRTPRQGAWMKSEGMLSGVPDLFIALPCGRYHGLFIEMKSPTGRVTDNQRVIMTLLGMHYRTEICRSFEEAKAAVENYMK